MNGLTFGTIIVLCGTTISCSGDLTERELNFRIGTDLSVAVPWTGRVNRNTNTVFTEVVPRIVGQLRLSATIGDTEGDLAFGYIAAFAVLPESQDLIVVDRQWKRISRITDDGNLVWRVGREGAGPGEFKDPIGIALSDNGFVVADPGNARYSLFDSSGVYIDQINRPLNSYSIPWQGVFSNGRVHELTRVSRGSRRAVVQISRDGIAQDTTFLPDFEPDQFELVSGNSITRASVPFAPSQLTYLSSDGSVLFAISDTYSVTRLGPGEHRLNYGALASPAAVTAAERAKAIDGLQWFVSKGGRVDQARVFDDKPVLRGFATDEYHQTWVMPSSRETARGFDVFGVGGELLGHVKAPTALRSLSSVMIRGGKVFGVTIDSLGVQRIAVLDVVLGPG